VLTQVSGYALVADLSKPELQSGSEPGEQLRISGVEFRRIRSGRGTMNAAVYAEGKKRTARRCAN
jgi:hypothetical protein